MSQLNLITSNPVSDAFNAGQKRAADQQAADLTNAINEQSYSQNNQLFPSKLRQVTRAADQADLTYDTDLKEQPDTLMKSKNDAAKSTVDLGKAQEDFDFEQKQHPLTLAGDTADVATKQSQARVQTSTEGAQVSKANNDAIESAARAQVAQNGAKYDMEGRWVDLLSKNPQLAIAQADQYGVPPELVAMAQDQSKAEWLKTAWANITAQYPNATDAATRAAIFEQEIKTAGNSPTASSAMQIPAGSPKPTTRQDELRGIASQLSLTPGSRDFAAFMTSDGKTLPAQFLSTEEVAAAGFPVGTVVDRSGKVVYKPKGGGSGPFAGTGMDAQTANILLDGDPGSPEYRAAYNMAAQPKVTFDASTGKSVSVSPDMSAYRTPTGQGPQAAVPPTAAPVTAQGQAQPGASAPSATTGPNGLTVTQVTDPGQKQPTAEQIQAAQRGQMIKSGVDKLKSLYQNQDLNKWRMAAADTVGGMGPLGRTAASTIRTDAEQQFKAAQSEALEGMAAAITGAGVTSDQFERYMSMLPDPTVDKPEAWGYKLDAANQFLDVLLSNAGGAANAVNSGAGAIPEFTSPDDPAIQKLPRGAQFNAVMPDGTKKLKVRP